ncbi:site-specific DNA-methyltransferase [Lacrimispora saccharolytica]|nr:site-specific DNA-methyltransferase [Lacrimispora saccharolytica]
MDKMRMESPDMTAQNIEKIGALFPNCVTETVDENGKPQKAINFDLLRQMLSDSVIEGDEAYEFTWIGKKAAIVEANKPIRKTLRPCPEESKDWDTTENLYIEGDNLDVLKLLQESYLGKIKLIYIDPPYNTGGDSFIYPDDFTMDSDEYDAGTGRYDENGNKLFRENNRSNPRFHSKWCSMIYQRLLLARGLLSSDGLIFISIDDNEQENLKKISDEVFGASNFLTCVTRATGTPTGGGFDGLVNELDYMLVYAKDVHCAHINGLPMSEEDAKIYDQVDERGRYLIRPLRRTGGEDRREDRPTMYFPITAPDGTPVYPIGPTGYESRWICSPDTAKKMANEGMLAWKKTKRQGEEVWQVYQKFYLENRTKAPGNLWNDVEGNKKATRDIRNIFDRQKVFDFPKPVGFIKKILQIGSDKDCIVMDFFSGSATTAHAVMQLNAEDGGKRKFIMIQYAEEAPESSEALKAGYKNICEIGKERIRRVGDALKKDSPLTVSDLDVGFRVFKLDETNMKDVYYSVDEFDQRTLTDMISNIKEDRNALDLFFGCLLEWGLPLSLPYTSEVIDGCTVHTYNDGDLIACFDNNIPESVVKVIAKRKPLRAVFRDAGFASSPAKINVFEIFKLYMPESANEITKRVKVI